MGPKILCIHVDTGVRNMKSALFLCFGLPKEIKETAWLLRLQNVNNTKPKSPCTYNTRLGRQDYL